MAPGCSRWQNADVFRHYPQGTCACKLHQGAGAARLIAMLMIRRFEEKAGQLYGMGFTGFCHLYIGQEAVVVGTQTALKEGDQDHHVLSRPWSHAGNRHVVTRVMAELTDAVRLPMARAAPCTCFHGFYGGRYRRRSGSTWHRSCLCEQVSRYRQHFRHLISSAMAPTSQSTKLHSIAVKLPVIYVIEKQLLRHGHSGFAFFQERLISPSAFRSTFRASRSTVWMFAPLLPLPHSLPNDVNSGKGPLISEMEPTRYRGHSASDPAHRSKD